MASTQRKRQQKKLEDYSAAKQKKIMERIKLCGYDDMVVDDIFKEAGRLVFEYLRLKEDKRLEMQGYNNTLKDLEERMECLEIQKDLLRQPPQMTLAK